MLENKPDEQQPQPNEPVPTPVPEPTHVPESTPAVDTDFDINDVLAEIEKDAQTAEKSVLERATSELKKEVYTKDQVKLVMKEMIKKNREEISKLQNDFDSKFSSQINDFKKQLSELDNKTSNRVTQIPVNDNPYRERPKPQARDLFDLKDLSTEERMEIFRKSTGITLK